MKKANIYHCLEKNITSGGKDQERELKFAGDGTKP